MKDAIFCASAGRCGTQKLAALIEKAGSDLAAVHHEAQPPLIREALDVYQANPLDHKRTKDLLWSNRKTHFETAWNEKKIYVETANKLTFFLPTIEQDEEINARYIVMIREPFGFVRSGMRRNWYYNHPWDHGRLRPARNTKARGEFKQLTQFQKVCWLWAETYKFIYNFIEDMEYPKVLYIEFSEFIDKEKAPAIYQEVLDFVFGDKVKSFEKDVGQEFIGQVFNAGTEYDGGFPEPKFWHPTFKDQLNEICGDVMPLFNYNPVIASSRGETTYPTTNVRTPKHLSLLLPLYGGPLAEESVKNALRLLENPAGTVEDSELVVYDCGTGLGLYDIVSAIDSPLIRYIHTRENREHLGQRAIMDSLAQAQGKYGMFVSYDDRHHHMFVLKALAEIERNPDAAMVYFRTIMKDQDNREWASDDFKSVLHDNPLHRFLYTFANLGLCNAFYGLFRVLTAKKCFALHMDSYRAHDTIWISELAYHGKIIQLPELLFERTLTREKTSRFDMAQTSVIKSWGKQRLLEGLTSPYSTLLMLHVRLLQYWDIPRHLLNNAIETVRTIWVKKFHGQLNAERDWIVNWVKQGAFYSKWSEPEKAVRVDIEGDGGVEPIETVNIMDVLRHLENLAFAFPGDSGIREAQGMCYSRMGLTE